ncbi:MULTISPECIES: hypothetical protein [unclassified Lysobacter]|uniref:hypothetical protein n=1 Tax=unclassified Lysobacter TaxID=2635362 RepID=UPI001BE65727|nr:MULTISPECIES: hypothetical protein [unclassified Lysobacter]MBT2750088.1 hypothetical protein [Lysobacter sp. ISL-50]MBT2775340.1 hypothetical protein [Lysobacter sp. ISL-54]MBT2783463.1 hypothetical protein [Lysobacter sp. ISL-52]
MNDQYRRFAGIAALWLGLMGFIGSSQAQFGATGSSALPLSLVFGPWIILLAGLPAAAWLRPAWRPRLCKAVRRGVLAYLFVEFVPLLVCLLIKGIFGIGQEAGLMAWALTMMGVIFSGLVLLTFILVALVLDWVVPLFRAAPSVNQG